MDLSHRGERKRPCASSGLAALVLAGSVGVGSMSGCGAALLAGAGYLAAEEIAQSNVEAAKIRAQRQANTREYSQAGLRALIQTKFFVCSYADPALDGNPATFDMDQDIIGRRTESPGTFSSSEGVYFVGGGVNVEPKEFAMRIFNNAGEQIYSEVNSIAGPQSLLYGFKPGELHEGRYKAIWYLNNTAVASAEAEVRSGSSVLTQK